MAAKIKKGLNHKIHHKAHFKCLIKRLYISVPQPRSPRKLKTKKPKKNPVPNEEFWLNWSGRWAYRFLIPVQLHWDKYHLQWYWYMVEITRDPEVGKFSSKCSYQSLSCIPGCLTSVTKEGGQIHLSPIVMCWLLKREPRALVNCILSAKADGVHDSLSVSISLASTAVSR